MTHQRRFNTVHIHNKVRVVDNVNKSLLQDVNTHLPVGL